MNSLTKLIQIYVYRLVILLMLSLLVAGCSSSSDSDVDPDADTGDITDTDDTDDTDDIDDTDALCDGDSRNDTWTDNCALQKDGLYGNSSYTKGVQRVVFCLGINPGNSASIEAFSDGLFGPNTEAAIMEFQENQQLVADGIVGPQTWGGLQDVLDLPQDFDVDYISYSVQGNGCGTEIQFYQLADQPDEVPFSWKMARTPDSPEMIQFSINGPDED